MLKDVTQKTLGIINRRPLFSASIAGSLLTLTYAPFDCWIVGFISFYMLLTLLENAATVVKAALYGFVFGFFYFATSLYWIGIALTVDIGTFFWLLPFAVCGIPTLLAVFIALLAAMAKGLSSSRMCLGLVFAILWPVTELLRSKIPFEFPWHHIAYTLSNHQNLLQISHCLGVSLTSLFVMLIFVTPFVAKRNYSILACVVLLSVWGIGVYRNHQAIEETYDLNLRLVQPCLHDFHMGDDEIKLRNLQKLLSVTLMDLSPNVNVIIWPEAALQYTLWEESKLPQKLGKILPSEAVLVTGSDRMDAQNNVYNSLVAISSSGQTLMTYDKVHLVPFGEFIPYRSLLFFMKKITDGIGDFSRGVPPTESTDYDPLTTAFYPLICYEVLFPLADSANSKKWLLNITNDAWFGNSLGPYQHLAMARFKAVSEGMSLVRVANNGISAVISPYGTVQQSLGLNVEGVIDAKLPKSLERNQNCRLFTKYANLLLYMIAAIVMLACVAKKSINSKKFPGD